MAHPEHNESAHQFALCHPPGCSTIPARGGGAVARPACTDAFVADKLTSFLLAALTRAAAEPLGLPLHATKAEPGLFPPAAAAKPAALKGVSEGYFQVVRTDVKGKQARDLYAATDHGLKFLLDHASPKQVLEDLVRTLEERRAEVGELLATAARMAASLDGLAAVVSGVLPRVESCSLPSPLGGEGGKCCSNPSPPSNWANSSSPAWATGGRPSGCRGTARCPSCSAA